MDTSIKVRFEENGEAEVVIVRLPINCDEDLSVIFADVDEFYRQVAEKLKLQLGTFEVFYVDAETEVSINTSQHLVTALNSCKGKLKVHVKKNNAVVAPTLLREEHHAEHKESILPPYSELPHPEVKEDKAPNLIREEPRVEQKESILPPYWALTHPQVKEDKTSSISEQKAAELLHLLSNGKSVNVGDAFGVELKRIIEYLHNIEKSLGEVKQSNLVAVESSQVKQAESMISRIGLLEASVKESCSQISEKLSRLIMESEIRREQKNKEAYNPVEQLLAENNKLLKSHFDDYQKQKDLMSRVLLIREQELVALRDDKLSLTLKSKSLEDNLILINKERSEFEKKVLDHQVEIHRMNNEISRLQAELREHKDLVQKHQSVEEENKRLLWKLAVHEAEIQQLKEKLTASEEQQRNTTAQQTKDQGTSIFVDEGHDEEVFSDEENADHGGNGFVHVVNSNVLLESLSLQNEVADQLKFLESKGFKNKTLNTMLLKTHHGDVHKTLAALEGLKK